MARYVNRSIWTFSFGCCKATYFPYYTTHGDNWGIVKQISNGKWKGYKAISRENYKIKTKKSDKQTSRSNSWYIT